MSKLVNALLRHETTFKFWFQYLDEENHDHNLSVTVIPCSSAIKWSFLYRTSEELKEENFTAPFENDETRWYEVESMETITIKKAKKGWYLVAFYPLGGDTLANVYVTMDNGSPHEVMVPQKTNIILTPQRGRKLKVSWKQTLLNPQNTIYCLVVNTHKEYPSLCGAQEEGPIVWGLDVPMIMNLKNFKLEKKWRVHMMSKETSMKDKNDTVIVCMDRETELTFTKLRKRVKYYFNLFAINNKTNLTVPYGKSYITYNFTLKPIMLEDGIQKTVDLRKLEGKAVFRYKVTRQTSALHFYVLACGGAVDVKFQRGKGAWKKSTIFRNDNSSISTSFNSRKERDRLPKQTRVFGYKRFRILYPSEGEQYQIKVTAPNVDELTRTKYVEVFVTSQPARKYPFPYLPDDPGLYEFKSKKTCRSVTIGWITVRDVTVNTYCVAIWENRKFIYADLFRGYFQCDLKEISRRKLAYFPLPREAAVHKHCEKMFTREKKSVTNYEISNLKPGRSYTVQVTVTKKNGRKLSYKFLKVHTKYACDTVKLPGMSESA
ncbi:hypothetical protein RUM44_009139 [Polyplax serrata]|uniref:Protein NDNF n=1 Tax=Polyplax serrata TaxID=468196 RepID=A0ABR1ATC9_POLSC